MALFGWIFTFGANETLESSLSLLILPNTEVTVFFLKYFPRVQQPESEFRLSLQILGRERVSLSDNPTALSQSVRHTAGKLRKSLLGENVHSFFY